MNNRLEVDLERDVQCPVCNALLFTCPHSTPKTKALPEAPDTLEWKWAIDIGGPLGRITRWLVAHRWIDLKLKITQSPSVKDLFMWAGNVILTESGIGPTPQKTATVDTSKWTDGQRKAMIESCFQEWYAPVRLAFENWWFNHSSEISLRLNGVAMPTHAPQLEFQERARAVFLAVIKEKAGTEQGEPGPDAAEAPAPRPEPKIVVEGQCSSSKEGARCHKIEGHPGEHHNTVMNCRWPRTL